MDRTLWLNLWNEAQESGVWAGSWPALLDGLTAEQAATRPHGRNSIWQLVSHMTFWREDTIQRATGGSATPEAEMERRNFEQPAKADEAAWKAACERLRTTHERVRELVADGKVDISRLKYMLPHDCYHFGQIAYIRALLGLPAVA